MEKGEKFPKPKYQEVLFTKKESEGLLLLEKQDQLTYSWNNVNVYTKAKKGSGLIGKLKSIVGRKPEAEQAEKHILKNVSGICRPGELLAIMGASGAGKTTLLNVLNYRNNDKVTITGDLFLNGQRVDPESLPTRSAYVQQDDMFIGTLTVREQLIFQAMLRMDRHLTREERMIRVDDVITELGLSKCADTKIGVPGRTKGISGGETKRLAFACEVLTNPPLLFCDEPTSGLDSFMAQNVVAVMKNMAEKGKTILSTIHQPSSEVYAMFDRVLLMAEGRVAFLGDVDGAYEFFGRISYPCPANYNPADFFILTLAVQPGRELECRKSNHNICDQFAQSLEGKEIVKAAFDNQKITPQQDGLGFDFMYPIEQKHKYKAKWSQQFRVLLWRSWLEIARETMIVKIRFLQVMLIGILIGVLYYNQKYNQEGVMNINGVMFLHLSNMTFQNVFGVINVFCNQIPIFLREHFNGMYRVDTYFLAKNLAELPFYTFYPILYSAITYYQIGLVPGPVNFLISTGILVLVANISISFGYLISCVAKNLTFALTITLPFVIPFMLFGGFFLNLKSVPPYLSWLQYISWYSYSNEALNINQWSNVSTILCSGTKTCAFESGEAVLSYYHYDEGSILNDALCLAFLLFFYRILAFLALLSKTYRKRH